MLPEPWLSSIWETWPSQHFLKNVFISLVCDGSFVALGLSLLVASGATLGAACGLATVVASPVVQHSL